MIEIVEGVGVGAGKSYYTATRILCHLAAGGSVYASTTFGLLWDEAKRLGMERFGVVFEDGQYSTFAQEDIPRLHEVTPCGTDDSPVLVIVDEAHIELNSRDWADRNKRPFFNWLTQSRHQNTDLIFISQAAANMDKQIGRLATRIIRMRNLVGWSIPGIGKWPLKQFVIGTYDRDGKTLQNRRFVSHDKGIFSIYDSKVMRSAHKRADGVVPRRILKKSTTRNPMYVKIFVLILCVLGFVVYRTWDSNPLVEMAGLRSAKVEPRAVASAPASSAPVKPAYLLENEVLRASLGDYLRTDKGTYEVGQMSHRGLVVGIQKNVVKIFTPDRATLFVVCHGEERRQSQPVLASPGQSVSPVLVSPGQSVSPVPLLSPPPVFVPSEKIPVSTSTPAGKPVVQPRTWQTGRVVGN